MDWIEAEAPGIRAIINSLPPVPAERLWRKHSAETAALCRRIVTRSNAELRAEGSRGVDSSPCSQACRACVRYCGEA